MLAHNAEHFGTLPTGEEVRSVTIFNGGCQAKVMSYGASLLELRLDGVGHSVVLGSPTFKPYLTKMRYFGAIVGRVANRIKGGVLTLDGKSHALDRNEEGKQTLHGGGAGTGLRNWHFDHIGADRCSLSCVLEDGEDGFPGLINISVEYRLEENGTLVVDLAAEAEAKTVCNLAHHSYWCLDGAEDCGAHQLWIDADHYLPVDDLKIPTGEVSAVENTGFDFKQARRLNPAHPIDHNFCLNGADAGLRKICQVITENVGLDIYSDQPGLQVYDASAMDTAPYEGHGGRSYGAFAGLALEPQKWPDAQHNAHFPSIILEKGLRYQQRSAFHAYRRT